MNDGQQAEVALLNRLLEIERTKRREADKRIEANEREFANVYAQTKRIVTSHWRSRLLIASEEAAYFRAAFYLLIARAKGCLDESVSSFADESHKAAEKYLEQLHAQVSAIEVQTPNGNARIAT